MPIYVIFFLGGRDAAAYRFKWVNLMTSKHIIINYIISRIISLKEIFPYKNIFLSGKIS